MAPTLWTGERLWTRVVTEGADGTTAVAVAECNGEIIGTASAGDPGDDDATWPVELFVLYLLSEFQGSGTGPRLLDAVICDRPTALWVADRNPRAQAFYRKTGLSADGDRNDEDIPEIRMVRTSSSIHAKGFS